MSSLAVPAHDESARPHRVTKPFWTPGTFVLLTTMAVGYAFGLTRFFTGLGTVTNLDNQFAWGVWKAVNVACGIALAASGFTSAALVDIFGQHRFRPLLRPAILTAWLGYAMAALALVFDIGRYWNIWRPIFFWQGNSVLFEVAMCVIAYLIVLTLEMGPALLAGFQDRIKENDVGAGALRRVERGIYVGRYWLTHNLPFFIVAGFVLSCMHHSSLGTLMMIAATKLDPMWMTPLLPLEFLLSAMMVGLPMVMIEAILASRAFGYRVDQEMLGALAKKVPWLIGIYGAVRLGDLVVRRAQIDWIARPELTLLLAVEIGVGLVAPFILLTRPAIRRSRGWLFFANLLVVFGVVLNRLNVYLLNFDPPTADLGAYAPSIGELALTAALVATILFGYRFFVTFFPILPAGSQSRPRPTRAEHPTFPVTTGRARLYRASAVVMLLAFAVLYSVVHREAIARTARAFDDLHVAREATPPGPHPQSSPHAGRPGDYRNFYHLETADLNRGTDLYETVRFTHRTHDVNTGGDCGVCHHRVGYGDDDRIGEDLRELHEGIEVRIGGACASCHADLADKTFQSCRNCHGSANEADAPARLGLKGAYHQQCIGCHEKQPADANAPVDCRGCHRPRVPDHAPLLTLVGAATPRQVTESCLTCHAQAGQDVLKSAHWNWRGQSPAIAGQEYAISNGLMNVIDNYTISMLPELVPTGNYHVSTNWGEEGFDFQDAGAVDCLICHDVTGTYRKDAGRAAPAGDMDMATLAGRVGHPTRGNCTCHFTVAGGPNLKHGDLSPALISPSAAQDFHMGQVDLRCQDCHATTRHQVAGLSFNAPVVEGRVRCEQCHGERPHGITGDLSKHLDRHVASVACETCHIPTFARDLPTEMLRDFAPAGGEALAWPAEVRATAVFDSLGAGNPAISRQTWGRGVVPVYRWFDGTRESYLIGQRIDPRGTVVLNRPRGERQDPAARIFPFKLHVGRQPYDTGNAVLAPVKFRDGVWRDGDWGGGVAAGMKAAGLEYSGAFDWVRTEMYTSIHHEVPASRAALGCADCHDATAVSCRRCHTLAAGWLAPPHAGALHPQGKRLDFTALGYPDDPARTGGRFAVPPGLGRPPR